MSIAASTRLSLPLTSEESDVLDSIRSAPEQLEALGLTDRRASGAAVAHAVFREGLRSLQERTAVSLYAAMAADAEQQRLDRLQRERLTRRGRDLGAE